MIFASLSLLLVAIATFSEAQVTDTLFVDDLLTHTTVNHTWMEIGYVNLTDTEWTTVTTTVNNLNPYNNREMSVFMSLPEYGGPTVEDGWSMVVKMNGRATRLPSGAYQFQARLVQPNDSYCPKLWWTPEPSPTINVGWLIVEEGVYNVTSSMLVFGSGNITRDNSVPLLSNDTPALYHAKYTMNYTTGCDENDLDAVCEFTWKQSDFPVVSVPNLSDRAYSTKGWSHLGATNQIQTSVNKVPDDPSKELWMNTRVRNVFLDRIDMMLAVHSVFVTNETDRKYTHNVGPDRFNFTIYPDYADIHTPEIASYFVWEKNMRLTCIEGLVMETSIQFPVTSLALHMDYYYEFETIPGLFGMIGTLQSVGDTTSLRVFNRTINGAQYITQEDQCTDEEETHINPEAAFSMVVGKAKNIIGNTHCFIAYDVQPCRYTIYLYDLFMDGWDNVELVVDTGDDVHHFTTSCGAKKVQFTSRSCSWNAHMQTIDGGKPITWWENYWSYEHESTGFEMTYLGDYDTTITVEREIVTFTDLANSRVDAKENKCEQCRVAPPPPAKGAKGKGKGAEGPGEGDGEGQGDGNSANGGVADLTAGNVAPAPPAGVGVYPGDAAGPYGVLQITGVSAPIDSSAPAGARSFTVVYALNVVALTSAVESITFNRGASGMTGDIIHSLDITGLTTAFYLEGSFVVSEADIISWINGEIYIQVNTANHMTGEIRAQAVLPSDWIDYYTYMNGGSPNNGNDDISGDGFGHGADDDMSKGSKGSGSRGGDDDRAKPGPVPVLIELFDDEGKGWYNHSGTWSYPMKTVPDDRRRLHQAIAIPARQNIVLDTSVATFPDILMYPTYVIMNVEKTKQLHVGSLCPHREVERCEERLPPHGEFVFRVMGKDPEGDDHWKFCGVHGHIGQELQFEMKKGKCVPVSLTNAFTFCSLNSILTVSGGIILAGVSTDFSEVDSRVLENEVASMLVSTTQVSINSWNVNADGNMEVAFEASLVAEKQGVDGSIRSNVDALVSTLQSNIVTAFSSGAFLSSLDTALSEHPQDQMSITHATGAFLTSLEIVDIKYVEASTAVVERTPTAISAPVEESADVNEVKAEEGMSTIATACAVVGVVVIIAALALRSRKSSAAEFSHQELAVDSEHADSIPEFDLGLEPASPKGMFFTSKERF